MLQMPCSPDMIERPYLSWTTTPLAFIATSSTPLVAPNSTSAAKIVGSEGANAMSETLTAIVMPPIRVMPRLPNRAISQAATGAATSPPTAAPISATPSPADDRCRASLTQGTR